MVWLVLQVMAMMVAALSGMFDQWLGKRAGNDPHLFLAAFGLVSLPVTVIGVVSQPFMWKAALVGLVSGLCFSATLLLYYRAVAMESLLVLALPGRLVAALALPLNGLIFGEQVSGTQAVVFMLLIIGGWLLLGGKFRLSRGFWLMVGVELLYVTQDVLKNMVALEYDAFLMLTWERAGVVLGALLVLAAKERRADVRFKISALGARLRLLLLCRPLAHVLISLLAGLAVQASGTVTMVVIAGGAYPFVVAALAYLANTKSPTRLYIYLRDLITVKPKMVANFVEV